MDLCIARIVKSNAFFSDSSAFKLIHALQKILTKKEMFHERDENEDATLAISQAPTTLRVTYKLGA
jgi:hypothetical protein